MNTEKKGQSHLKEHEYRPDELKQKIKERDLEYQAEEDMKNREKGYYINLPSFGKKGPSKLRQQFNKGMTAFIVIVTCILFFFAMLRMDDISKVVRLIVHILKPVIYGLGLHIF